MELILSAATYASEPLIVVDATGNVIWANDSADHTFPLPGISLAGTNALDLLHPDDQDAASIAIAAGLALVATGTGRHVLTPTPYRLRFRGGEHRWFEVSGRSHPDLEGGKVLVVSTRDIGRQQRLTHAGELIAEAAPIEAVVNEVIQGIECLEPCRMAGISWLNDDSRQIACDSLPPELVWTDHPDDPWMRAVATGATVGAALDELRPELQEAARRCGALACAAVPVDDPASAERACLVLWTDHEAIIGPLQLWAHRQAHSLLLLAFAQRFERRQLMRAATLDSLTGLLNRREFLRRLHVLQSEATPVTMLFCDVDEFKPVNDRYGHEVGDRVLQILADRLQATVRNGDLVGRVGGDEFAVAAVGLTERVQVAALAQRVIATVSQSLSIETDGEVVVTQVGLSVGVATPEPPGPRSADILLAVADRAMYTAKRAGRGGWHLMDAPVAV